jgi:hypothetical protein
MKKVLLGLLMLSGVLAFGQTPKVLRVKTYKDGKIIGTKTYNLIQPANVTVTKTTQSKPKTRIVVKKQIVKVPEYKIVNVQTPATALDTVAILQQYYPKNVHKETITLEDGVGKIQITDTISHNRLVSRKWIADVKPQIKEKIVEIYRPKTVQWYMGPHMTTNFSQPFQSFGISVVRKSLNDNLIQFQIGGNVHENAMRSNPYIGIGGLLKLN